jgi:DNA-binding MarR family transcriptional regulator
MRNGQVSIETFIEYYMTAQHNGQTREEFAHDLGVKPATVAKRANSLRRKGIPLPPMPLNRRKSFNERARDSFDKMQAAFQRIEVKKREDAARKAEQANLYPLDKKKIEQFVKERLKRKGPP